MIFLLSKTSLIGKKNLKNTLVGFFAQIVTAAQDNHEIFLIPPQASFTPFDKADSTWASLLKTYTRDKQQVHKRPVSLAVPYKA